MLFLNVALPFLVFVLFILFVLLVFVFVVGRAGSGDRPRTCCFYGGGERVGAYLLGRKSLVSARRFLWVGAVRQ